MKMAYMLFIFEVHSDVTSVRNPKLACLLGGKVDLVKYFDPNSLRHFDLQNMCVQLDNW